MFHRGRCGSNVLGDMLNAHSKVFWDSEIFVKYMKYMESEKRKQKREFVERTIEWSRHREVSMIYGFDTKYLSQQHLSHKCITSSLEDYIIPLRKLGFLNLSCCTEKVILDLPFPLKLVDKQKDGTRSRISILQKKSLSISTLFLLKMRFAKNIF